MKTNLTSIGTAAVAATLLLAGAAHAQEPADKTAPDAKPAGQSSAPESPVPRRSTSSRSRRARSGASNVR